MIAAPTCPECKGRGGGWHAEPGARVWRDCQVCKPAAPAPVYCSTCDHVSPRTRDLDGWRWRCLAYPRADDPHYLGPGVRAREPHYRCADRNTDGQCPKWTPRKGKTHD